MVANKKRTRSNSASNERKTKKMKKDFVLRVKLYNRKEGGKLESLIKIRINPAKKLKTLFKLINDEIAGNRLKLSRLTVDRDKLAIPQNSDMSIKYYGITDKSLLVGTVERENGWVDPLNYPLKSSGSARSSDYSFSDWERSLSKDKHN